MPPKPEWDFLPAASSKNINDKHQVRLKGRVFCLLSLAATLYSSLTLDSLCLRHATHSEAHWLAATGGDAAASGKQCTRDSAAIFWTDAKRHSAQQTYSLQLYYCTVYLACIIWYMTVYFYIMVMRVVVMMMMKQKVNNIIHLGNESSKSDSCPAPCMTLNVSSAEYPQIWLQMLLLLLLFAYLFWTEGQQPVSGLRLWQMCDKLWHLASHLWG